MTALQDRLPPPTGRFIDRSRPLAFTFEGRRYSASAGDTVASALAANGFAVLSRSFKYHRPRGILSLAGCEANTLVEVNGVPNVPAERHRLADGDRVCGQNYAGSLAFDRSAWIGAFARFLPVGFYYRTFFRPRGAWALWEPFIRRRAGIGRIDEKAPHRYFDKAYLFADVAVIGAGPAGLAAAIAAAETGGRVILVDDQPGLGGSLTYARFDPEGRRANETLDALLGQLSRLANVITLTDASCEGLFADNWLAITRGTRLYKLRAGAVVLATGAFAQPAVFRRNDLPGIMLGSAAQRLIRQYGVRPGRRAVVLTANDDGYGVALDLAEAGVDIAAIVDLRSDPGGSIIARAAERLPARVLTGCAICEAIGRSRVRRVEVSRLRPDGTLGEPIESIACDLVCMAVGFAPNLALAAHAGARLAYDSATAMQRAVDLPENVIVTGAANQCFSLETVIADGSRAGAIAAGGPAAREAPHDPAAAAVTHRWPIFPHPRGKEFVDFDEDLTIKDIGDTIDAGFDDIQLLKRYSTAGMGPSQGRHSAINILRLASRLRGEEEGAIGTTTTRPPYSGESFGLLAGRSFDPVRRTAMHHRHIEAGARMMVAGAWMRPVHYSRDRDAESAIAAEVQAVRESAGLIDVSTLGKIEIRGPEAGEFLNRIYFTPHLKQPLGRGRYAVMTDVTGAVVDDGVICRFADNHYFVTATTSGVDAVVRSMYFWNAQWRLDVDIANVTAAYAAVNLAGPAARVILASLCDDVDLSAEAFPYMGVRAGHVAGIPARLLRVGFVGELGYEIHVPAGCGEGLWDALVEAGRRHGIRPFGVEAQRVLRLEKGHVIVGQDTDGLTHPLEIGLAVPASKPFFVGAAAIAAHRDRGVERQLVGFTIDDDAAPVPKECHLVIDAGEIAGRVTSCVRSPTLEKVIGLAFVRSDQAAIGQTFTIRADRGALVTARVVPLPFYDPDNARQKL